MNPRQEHGKIIASKANQIVRLDDHSYTVNSQSSDRMYEILSTEHG